jgi:hypothetical protein
MNCSKKCIVALIQALSLKSGQYKASLLITFLIYFLTLLYIAGKKIRRVQKMAVFKKKNGL